MNWYKNILLSALLLLSFSIAFSQKENSNYIRIGFWNVENFFDPRKDSLKNDNDFTPEGLYRWTFQRFDEKKNKLYKTIVALGEGEPPAIFGLCEIENAWVLHSLCMETPLAKYKYQYIHYESPDIRGIDVGLIYRPDLFSPVESFPIRILFPDDSSFKTRDILFVKGIVFDSDTIGLFVNHFPSKLGGAAADEKRNFVAQTLKDEVNKQLARNPNHSLILLGDFNDDPYSYSIKTVLDAAIDSTELQTKVLMNLMTGELNEKGSYKYQEQWAFIDQIIVTRDLYFRESNLNVKNNKAVIFNPAFLQVKDDKYLGTRPFRTFIGDRYNGGFSDHFPVYIDLEKRK